MEPGGLIRLHKTPQLATSLSQNSTPLQSQIYDDLLLFSLYTRLVLPSSPFLPGFLTKISSAMLISPMRDTRTTYSIPLDLNTLIISGEQQTVPSSSMCCFIQFTVTCFVSYVKAAQELQPPMSKTYTFQYTALQKYFTIQWTKSHKW
jgi:hypothetical protein